MAKTYSHLLPKIFAFDNLHSAYLKARKGKRKSRQVLEFSRDLEPNLIQLQNEIIWGEYRTGPYRYFSVHEPKERQVAALSFRDRVVQHAINNIIEPIWEARFISDSYACRPGKGTHAGADRVQAFLRQVQQRHGRAYCLKADITKYFASIDHEALRALLRKRIACRGTLDLLDEIIASTTNPAAPVKCGIPIGNLSSQLFANIYLHALDEHVKYTLREPCYVRYMDDFVIIHHDKAHLHGVRRSLEAWLNERLRLTTNSKTQVFPVHGVRGRAVDFLGYRIWVTRRKLRKDSITRMRAKMKRFVKLYAAGKVTLDRVRATVHSWVGHARHADSYRVRERVLGSAVFIPPGRDYKVEAPEQDTNNPTKEGFV